MSFQLARNIKRDHDSLVRSSCEFMARYFSQGVEIEE